MIGYGATFLAFLMTCSAAFFYFKLYRRQNNQRLGKNEIGGNVFYYLSAAFALTAALNLLAIILADQFQYAYVFGYSSRELSLIYKLSSFWAGQEGSFMLWLIFHVMFGLLLVRKKTAPPGVMGIYSTLQAMLIVILLVKSPFLMLTKPETDGMGLNPLLQDPWMVIHPPLVFLGYAGLAVPFAYAMEGLLSRRHSEWISSTMSWTLLSWTALGAGVFIGGFWAYKVLGWGGYWAWDPVENSSLVPWLLTGVVLHSLFLARQRPTSIGFAYFACICSFISVLFGTFLTRSGVLSDFSTHSFANEGVGGLLAGIVLIVIFGAFLLLILRWPSIPQGEMIRKVKSREFMLAATALVLFVMAAIVFIGMSAPLFTMLLGNPQSVSITFYNTMFLPLAAVMALFFTLIPIFTAGQKTTVLRKYWWLFAVGIISAIAAAAFGLKQPFILLAVSFSCTAILSNAVMGYKKLLSHSAALAHAGVAVMMLGIIISSTADETVSVSFEKQQTQEVFGRSITYLGAESIQTGNGFYQNFVADSLGEHISLRPYTKLNKESNPVVREPGIYHSLAGDLYIAPAMNSENETIQEISLSKGEQMILDGLKIAFMKFGMAGIGNEDVCVQAYLQVSRDGVTEKVTPSIEYRNGHIVGVAAKAFDQYEFTLNNIKMDQSAAVLGYRNLADDSRKNHIDVEISHKPLIHLVWLGAVLITLSTGLAAYKRLAHN